MEMILNITIEKLVANIKLAEREDNILAFGELLFYETNATEPIFKEKGFTIRKKQFGTKNTITVDFPAFPAGGKYVKSFLIENKSLWGDVVKLFLATFKEQTGDAFANSDIDIDQIAEEIDKIKTEKDKDIPF